MTDQPIPEGRMTEEVKPARCPKEIWYPPGWTFAPCGRKAGPSGFCGIHSPDAVQKRGEKSSKLYEDARARSPYAAVERLRAALASERKLRRELQEAAELTAGCLRDLEKLGRFAASVDPGRWAEQVLAPLQAALAHAAEHDAETGKEESSNGR